MIFSFVEKTSSRTHWTHRTLPAVKQAKKHRPQPWPRAISLASSCTQPQMQPENCRGNGGVVPTRILLRVFVNAILHLSSCKLEQFFVYFIVQTCNLYIYTYFFVLQFASCECCNLRDFSRVDLSDPPQFFRWTSPDFSVEKKNPRDFATGKKSKKKKTTMSLGKWWYIPLEMGTPVIINPYYTPYM